MTEGRPLRLIALFALPLLLNNAFQQLYNVVDSIVVGRLIGVDAFAAVGAAGSYYWLALAVVLGFTQGFGALFAQRFGAKDEAGLKRAIAQAVVLTTILSALLTAAFLLLLHPALVLVNTPPDIIGDTYTYLLWVLSATPVMFAYNTCAAILRALGNSRAPLMSVIISTAVNIVLDLAFVGLLGMGVASVAVATVIANCCALVYCFLRLRRIREVRIGREDFKHGPGTIRTLMKLGGPLAFRNLVIETGGQLIQYVINGYGTLYVAGIAAAYKYFGFISLVGFSLDGAMSVYVGQNYGADRLDRIKKGMRTARWIAVVSSVVTAGLTALFGREMVLLLITGDVSETAAVAEIGYHNLLAFSACLPALYLLFIYRSAIQGMGNSLIPMASGFIELAMRVLSVFILPLFIGIWGVYFSVGIGWIAAAVMLIISYYAVYRRRFKAVLLCGAQSARCVAGTGEVV